MMTPTIVRPSTQHKGSLDILNNIELGIVRQFPFSSSLQRMSVVIRRLGAKNFDLYVKGSPEMITSLSKPETIPQNFHQVLQSYTQHGYRVIALASKQLSSKLNYVKIQRINRQELVQNEELVSDIILRALDLITIAIPPALPAALAVGIVFSQRRLKVKDVYCISPRGINVCGTINAVCFDKTGTITEDGLDMHGVVEVKNSKFSPILRDTTHLHNGDLLFGMACCHSHTNASLVSLWFACMDWDKLKIEFLL
uniref:Cation-transporting P-type ATPase N-terminal domain-containing protein n=1 Tax=Biomphalaria glabrata TaxID=6526 RepID=A0A2C9K9B0_BIOGL